MKKWLSTLPTQCDYCKRPFTEGTFIDGRTRQRWWAILCRSCWETEGVGLGPGDGQEYDAKTGVKVWG